MKCNAYIDPETGIALEGEALAAASENPGASRCGYELYEDDVFCPSCGAKVEPSLRQGCAVAEDIPPSGERTDAGKKPSGKRASRSAFWVAAAAFFLTNLAWFVMAGDNYGLTGRSLVQGLFLKVLGYVNLFAYVYFVKTSVFRLHDIGRSGWWIAPSVFFSTIASALSVIAVVCESDSVVFDVFNWIAIVVNVVMVAWLGFVRGTSGHNKYGSDPLALADGNAQDVPKARSKLRFAWIPIVVVVIGGLVSFVFHYYSERENDRLNAMFNWQFRNIPLPKEDFSKVLKPQLGSLLKTSSFDGMFGVKFGERVPSDVTTLTDGTEGTLMLFFNPPKSPELVFSTYCKTMLPKSREVCGIQGMTNFSKNEQEQCSEMYEKYKKDIDRRYGEMTSLKRKPGRSSADGSEEVCKSIVECEDKRIITLEIRKAANGGYLLKLVALDMSMLGKLADEVKQASSDLPRLEGLFGRKLGERAGVSDNEMRLADGSIMQTFEPAERFLDFELYAMQILPKSRTIFTITAVHSCATMADATDCFTTTCLKIEERFKQKMMDNTATFDTSRPDEDGELILKSALLSFPNGMRFIGVQVVKDVNENAILVRLVALDQKYLNTLGAETATMNTTGSAARLEGNRPGTGK